MIIYRAHLEPNEALDNFTSGIQLALQILLCIWFPQCGTPSRLVIADMHGKSLTSLIYETILCIFNDKSNQNDMGMGGVRN